MCASTSSGVGLIVCLLLAASSFVQVVPTHGRSRTRSRVLACDVSLTIDINRGSHPVELASSPISHHTQRVATVATSTRGLHLQAYAGDTIATFLVFTLSSEDAATTKRVVADPIYKYFLVG